MKALTLTVIAPALFAVFACSSGSSNMGNTSSDSTMMATDEDSDPNTEQAQSQKNVLSDE